MSSLTLSHIDSIIDSAANQASISLVMRPGDPDAREIAIYIYILQLICFLVTSSTTSGKSLKLVVKTRITHMTQIVLIVST